MNYHIVRMNETLSQIALSYNLEKEEIKSCNMHIRDWENLIAGTRLALPAIPNALSDELNDIEPFIEDYYPKLKDLKIDESVKEEVTSGEDEKVNLENSKNQAPKLVQTMPKKSVFYNGYYPPYPSYYYPYYIRRRKTKK